MRIFLNGKNSMSRSSLHHPALFNSRSFASALSQINSQHNVKTTSPTSQNPIENHCKNALEMQRCGKSNPLFFHNKSKITNKFLPSHAFETSLSNLRKNKDMLESPRPEIEKRMTELLTKLSLEFNLEQETISLSNSEAFQVKVSSLQNLIDTTSKNKELNKDLEEIKRLYKIYKLQAFFLNQYQMNQKNQQEALKYANKDIRKLYEYFVSTLSICDDLVKSKCNEKYLISILDTGSSFIEAIHSYANNPDAGSKKSLEACYSAHSEAIKHLKLFDDTSLGRNVLLYNLVSIGFILAVGGAISLAVVPVSFPVTFPMIVIGIGLLGAGYLLSKLSSPTEKKINTLVHDIKEAGNWPILENNQRRSYF